MACHNNYSNDYSNLHKQKWELTNREGGEQKHLSALRTRKNNDNQAVSYPPLSK